LSNYLTFIPLKLYE